MSADRQEQEDELLALHSIFGSDEFLRDESKFGGELRVCVELPAAFTVALKEGKQAEWGNIMLEARREGRGALTVDNMMFSYYAQYTCATLRGPSYKQTNCSKCKK